MSELLAPTLMVQEVPKEVLPNPDEISYYVLEKERKLYLDFDVCEDMMSVHRMILRWNMEDKGKPVSERKPIGLYIQSPGGELTYMWMLIDAIEQSQTPVYTVNIGLCASAATLIYLAGHKRFMMPYAKVLIHEGHASMAGDANKIMNASESYKKELKAMKDYILSHTAIPKQLLMKRRTDDWEIDAKFCLENKVCDVIVDSLDEVI